MTELMSLIEGERGRCDTARVRVGACAPRDDAAKAGAREGRRVRPQREGWRYRGRCMPSRGPNQV